MAAPGFSTPQAKRPSRARRHFTVEQANRTLPLVTRVVRDIVNAHERLAQLQGKMEEAGGKEAASLQEQVDATQTRLAEYEHELATIGVELKDQGTGLIDFPGRHQGRDVYLCWKLGEDKVTHWHELHTGYSGRQPVGRLEEE